MTQLLFPPLSNLPITGPSGGPSLPFLGFLQSLVSALQNGAGPTLTDAGTVNVIGGALPGVNAYANLGVIAVAPFVDNTGPVTINANDLGPVELLFRGAPLSGGELIAGQYFQAIYDGAHFQLLTPPNNL